MPGTVASNSCAAPFAPAGWAAGRNSAGGEEMSVTSNGSKTDAFVGVDVGGTHTDVSVVIGSQVERGKALTTYDDFSRGVLEAVERRRRAASTSRSRSCSPAPSCSSTAPPSSPTRSPSCAAPASACSSPPASRTPSASPAARARPRSTTTCRSTSPTSSTAARSPRSTSGSTGRAASSSRSTSTQVKAAAKHLVEDVGSRRARDLLPLELRQRRARAGGRGGGPGALPGPLRHPVARRLPGRRARPAAGRPRC